MGQFTDELGGDKIVEFVSGGAKNYGYKTREGKVECKVRGFTLNYETLQTLNYETMKDNTTIPDYFQRDQVTKQIKLTERIKNMVWCLTNASLTLPLACLRLTASTGLVAIQNCYCLCK